MELGFCGDVLVIVGSFFEIVEFLGEVLIGLCEIVVLLNLELRLVNGVIQQTYPLITVGMV